MLDGRNSERHRRELRAFPALASAAMLACAWNADHADSAEQQISTAPKAYVVSIEGLRFDPPALTVNRGDRIVWLNKDLFPHTATAVAKAFDSRDIGPNASWTCVARTPGDYTYSCAYHTTMKGQLTVR